MFADTPTTASEWAVRINAGRWSDRDEQALERWLAQDPSRRAELALARRAWAVAHRLEDSAWARRELDALNRAAEASPPRRLFAWLRSPDGLTGAALALGAAMVAAYLGPSPFADEGLTHRLKDGAMAITAIGETKTYTLPDGSIVAMNADSMLQVDFSGATRNIVLERGEAFFEVTHDASRPFIVAAGPRSVQVTGTKFNVDYDAGEKAVQVAVVQGSVNVAKSNELRAPNAALSAGDVFMFPDGKPAVREKIAATQAAAWQSRRLYFEEAPLQQVVMEVNRYARKPLILESTRLAKRSLSGSFKAGDIETVLFSLKTIYDIDVQDTGESWVLAETPGSRGN